jgi:HAD superfamily hydrolase (TIGR01549 family)
MSNDAFSHIKAIFFDTSDTLYSSREMEEAYPQKLAELIAVSRKMSIDEATSLLSVTTKSLEGSVKHVTKVRAMAELGFTRSQVHEAFCKVSPKDYLSSDVQLDAMMSKLAQRHKLGIISNLKRAHILEILEALGLSARWFSLFITEDIVKEIKPDPEPFLKAVELSGYEAHECLYIGDSPTKDMRPAKEVGMVTVLVAKAPTKEDELCADSVIGDVKDLASLLA